MYEPHLIDHASEQSRPRGESGTLLEELDKIAPIKSFDAFPKVQSTYTVTSRRGGVLTTVVGLIIFLLVLNDLGEYLYGAPDYAFHVDHELQKDLQLNVDLTVAMPCHYLSIDLRDAVGDRLHLSDSFVKDGTNFNIAGATSMKLASPTSPSAHEVISSSRRKTPNQKRTFGGIQRLLFSPPTRRGIKKSQAAYRPTYDKVDDGPACRIYGSVEVKKVTANLHITTLGHGYMSFEHTDHKLMNLSHIVHEFSFGPFFPAISQPLDKSFEIAKNPFTIFQYFLRVVPTTYIDASRRKLVTSQYAVTDYSRSFEHGKGVPGIFFKYDLEAMALTVRERTTTLYQFLIRLVGVIGGVWTVASFGLRVFNRAQKEMSKSVVGKDKEYIPSSLPSNSPAFERQSSGYFGASGISREGSGATGVSVHRGDGGMLGAGAGGGGGWRGSPGGEWKGR
ncbi:endoplasmic reticulum-Golgi intermediate compartment protein 2 [Kwoniella heveanensis CBS 569]|uniref:Endoplasmic reticulum-Golgi intermediate compartment protein 2 n=1 Tax=Kwoniella heveanensis BCC8398 TaxID=1296120 RepID=A0A1B9GPD5_9TREE|nr:endoplasmic reticulum-Golgi intermediate compartment protein 2 [Kwoniella heveanensis BCC8398]OCF39644.1 endoplasmic reticulum-Golgi intermediate compartment protein 2 [Kwoniella heveanensis CBS 569]